MRVDEPTPRLYPVTLDVVCPTHGTVTTGTVLSLRAQQLWEEYFQKSHGRTCNEQLELLVSDDQLMKD